jgi:Ca2+-transporting ATPase
LVDGVWHSKNLEETYASLSSRDYGLSQDEAKERLEKYGPNAFEIEKGKSRLKLFLGQFTNPLFAVLIVAALISLSVGKAVDATVIFAVILLNAIIGFFQEYKAETALEALKSMAAPEASVLRDCTIEGLCIARRIKASEIVPGDVIVLSVGDKVPADARLIEAFNLQIDESSLTGESAPVAKITDVLPEKAPIADRLNVAYSGTVVTNGRGKAVVFATGNQSEIGKIASIIKKTEKAETPIKKRTIDLSRKLAIIALIASSLTFVIGLLKGFDFIEVFLFALASAVSAIPEGLPTVITLTLAIAVGRMAKRNAIIRKIQAVDTLGSATVICTDKTGTLTTNQMTAQKIYADSKIVNITGVGFAPTGDFRLNDEILDVPQNKTITELLHTAVLCNDSCLKQSASDRWEILGDPTEGALVVAAKKAGFDKEQLEKTMPRIDEVPFDSKTKFMVTFNKLLDDQVAVFCKGAPEIVLAMCSKIMENGEEKILTAMKKRKILEVNTSLANEALRVLAFAKQTIPLQGKENCKVSLQQGSKGLVFLGLIGLIDPPRPEAKKAVQLCKRAGIKVVMATGDHKLTASAIAKSLGIMQDGLKAFSGTDLDEMSDEQLDVVINETAVFARVSPEHKYRIVESLRRKGHIVAMTGDGVNDAPALKAAEIGIAMGITGTDVTKETADIVLADDNFATIVNAVEEGRVVFENVRKVVKYLISTNTGEIITVLSALILLSGVALILDPVQILWINLVTDGLLVVPIAMEAKEDDVMDKPPRNPKEKTISRNTVFNVIYVSLFMAIGTIWIFNANSGDIHRAQTLAFVTMATFQVFNALNCRSETKSVFKIGINKSLFAAIAATLALQFIVTSIPFLQTALSTTSLSLWDWLTVFLLSSSVLVADELRKFVRRRQSRKR